MEDRELKRDIIVLGASAGGLDALKIFLPQLPKDFSSVLFLVMHLSPEYPSLLPKILSRLIDLKVVSAVDQKPIEPGCLYIAPPDHHLLVETGHIRVSRGPKENRFRPSIDVLFRSAARAYGARVVGVVLSGGLDDGAAGLYAIKERGGKAVVQDPADALYPSMPLAARKAVTVDHCVPVQKLGQLLIDLSNEVVETKGENPVSKRMDIEVGVARQDNALEAGILELGEPSPYTCPECHGVLMKLKEGNLIRFRCHTGHAYSLNTLLTEVTGAVEDSLWNALRTIEESELLMNHLAKHLHEIEETEAAELLMQKVEEAKRRAELVRQAVMSNETLSTDSLRSEITDS
ncbi:chemotaxis protein CheB [Phormidium tenue FACHB-886]|nr:chemotaxis protein CheB [Phormidium tenue FACHB-886]